MEKVTYLDLPNCYRLSNGSVETIVTTEIGPRILRYGFVGQDNMLAELPEITMTTPLGDWKPWGGHRVWAAPESMPLSYAPDNSPVQFVLEGDRQIRLTGAVEPGTGLQKELDVTLAAMGTEVTICHRIINHNLWPVELAVWTLTIVKGGGHSIIPQEPYRSHDDYLLPARPLVLWHFTDLSDPRWTLGRRYIRLQCVADRMEPQKIGAANRQGWMAFHANGTLMVKRFPTIEGATYPDYGSNCETYTAGPFMEIEALGPLQRLAPGESAEMVERWSLFSGIEIGSTEDSLDAAIRDAIASTSPV